MPEPTMTNALDAAVRFIPTPPAFSDMSNTYEKTNVNMMKATLMISVL